MVPGEYVSDWGDRVVDWEGERVDGGEGEGSDWLYSVSIVVGRAVLWVRNLGGCLLPKESFCGCGEV